MRAPDTRGAVAVLARLGLDERDQLLEGIGLDRRVHGQKQRRARGERDGNEILVGVVGKLGIQERVDRVGRVVRHQQRIAVRRRLRHVFRAQDAVRPGLVLHDELLAPALGEFLPDEARDRVRQTARRITHDDAHGFFRVIFRALAEDGLRGTQRGNSQPPDRSTESRMHEHCSSESPNSTVPNSPRRSWAPPPGSIDRAACARSSPTGTNRLSETALRRKTSPPPRG